MILTSGNEATSMYLEVDEKDFEVLVEKYDRPGAIAIAFMEDAMQVYTEHVYNSEGDEMMAQPIGGIALIYWPIIYNLLKSKPHDKD